MVLLYKRKKTQLLLKKKFLKVYIPFSFLSNRECDKINIKRKINKNNMKMNRKSHICLRGFRRCALLYIYNCATVSFYFIFHEIYLKLIGRKTSKSAINFFAFLQFISTIIALFYYLFETFLFLLDSCLL